MLDTLLLMFHISVEFNSKNRVLFEKNNSSVNFETILAIFIYRICIDKIY